MFCLGGGSARVLAHQDVGAVGGTAVLLEPCGAQAAHAVPVDEPLPGQKLLDGKAIALAGLFEADQAGTHRRHDLCLAPNDPALGIGRRKDLKLT